jgi:hypothetical protein
MNASTSYIVKIDGHTYETTGPAVTGAQLLAIAGKAPAREFVIFLLLEDGDMESIRVDEIVDLQRVGIEAFRTFQSDVIYRLEVEGKPREWAARHITGRAIKRLAGVSEIDRFGVWQIKAHGDHFIEDGETIDLDHSGVERFRLGGRYFICLEGKVFEWTKETITTEEIIALGGWDPSQGAVEVDRDQNERQLGTGEVIRLTQGHQFCKKQRFKRGFDENSRIGQELQLLRKNFSTVEYMEVGNLHWFCIPEYALPPPLSPQTTRVVFSVTTGHPVPKPYGFYVAAGIQLGDQILRLGAAQNPPPYGGNWLFVSWDIENWRPGADVTSGDNLSGWARSFRGRLLEGE